MVDGRKEAFPSPALRLVFKLVHHGRFTLKDPGDPGDPGKSGAGVRRPHETV